VTAGKDYFGDLFRLPRRVLIPIHMLAGPKAGGWVAIRLRAQLTHSCRVIASYHLQQG